MRAKFALCTQRILAYFCAKVLRFLQWEIFSMDRKILKIPGINLHCLGNIWAKIISCHPPYKPIFAKNVLFRVQKYPKKTFRFLSKGRLNLMAKYSEPKKQIAKTFFPLGATRAWSSNLCAAEFPHYNSDPVKRVSWICDINGAKHLWEIERDSWWIQFFSAVKDRYSPKWIIRDFFLFIILCNKSNNMSQLLLHDCINTLTTFSGQVRHFWFAPNLKDGRER